MAEASSKPKIESTNYIAEIRQMMHGFGDCNEPLIESAKIIEDVVLHQMRAIVRRAHEIAEMRNNSKKIDYIDIEDFIFLLRKDKVKLKRLIKYLELKELKSSLNKVLDNDTVGDVGDDEKMQYWKCKGPIHQFLSNVDNTGEFFKNKSTVDEIKLNRSIRAEMISRSLDETHYINYSSARNVSFANKNRHKFSDWICPDADVTISKQGYMILAYLAYETVARIIDLALLVRQDQNKIHGDAIDRVRLGYVNPYTYKPYYHGKGATVKAITPSEINEAIRRYWSPQLDMAGPFNRWNMRRSHLKLFSC